MSPGCACTQEAARRWWCGPEKKDDLFRWPNRPCNCDTFLFFETMEEKAKPLRGAFLMAIIFTLWASLCIGRSGAEMSPLPALWRLCMGLG